MSGPRRSNVYDLSGLRLRPDGTRIQRSLSANSSLRYAAVAARDARGNWFAKDASGPRTVGEYRNKRGDVDRELEPVEPTRSAKGKEREKSDEGSELRSVKRQKFMDDFDFIAPDASTSSLPSSDLLKAIHYFASNYYHERGQLLNVTKEYRRMKKINRLSRVEQQREEEAEDGEIDAKVKKPVRRGGRVKGKGKNAHPTDMYRMFDGTALLAIGMLLEEYVKKFLEVRIPDGWEDMMEQNESEEEEDESDDGGGEVNETDADGERACFKGVKTQWKADNEQVESTLTDDDGSNASGKKLNEREEETDEEPEEWRGR